MTLHSNILEVLTSDGKTQKQSVQTLRFTGFVITSGVTGFSRLSCRKKKLKRRMKKEKTLHFTAKLLPLR